VSYVLKNANDLNMIRCWENERHSNKHIVLWYFTHNFIVILARRNGYLILKTAYQIEQNHRVRRLEKEMALYPDPRIG
jgi:hypothetical protein